VEEEFEFSLQGIRHPYMATATVGEPLSARKGRRCPYWLYRDCTAASYDLVTWNMERRRRKVIVNTVLENALVRARN
jgi:hypothetical protein